MSRKEEILDAVVDIFQAKGIQSDFTISELAQKVDIGKSTIYEYFSTKNEILISAFKRIFQHTIDAISKREFYSDIPFETQLKEELHFLLHLAKNSSNTLQFLTPDFTDSIPNTMKGDFAEKMKQTAFHYESLFTLIIQKGIKEGCLQPINIHINSMLVASLISGSVTRFTNVTEVVKQDVNLDDYVEAMYQTIVKLFN